MIWHDWPYCLCIRKPQVIRNFWAWKELVRVHYILHGFDRFTQSGYDIECYNIFICTCMYRHIAHTVYCCMYILYYNPLCLSHFLGSLLWMFSQIPLWTWKVSQNTFYYVHYLYHRNIVLNKHYWFSGTEELWSSHSGRLSKGTVLVFNSKHIVFVKRTSLNLSFQNHNWH